jgi:hypothetical protein
MDIAAERDFALGRGARKENIRMELRLTSDEAPKQKILSPEGFNIPIFQQAAS